MHSKEINDVYYKDVLLKLTNQVEEFKTETEAEFQYAIMFEFGQFMLDNIKNQKIWDKCILFINEELEEGTSITEELISLQVFSQFFNHELELEILRKSLSRNSLIIFDYYFLQFKKISKLPDLKM